MNKFIIFYKNPLLERRTGKNVSRGTKCQQAKITITSDIKAFNQTAGDGTVCTGKGVVVFTFGVGKSCCAQFLQLPIKARQPQLNWVAGCSEAHREQTWYGTSRDTLWSGRSLGSPVLTHSLRAFHKWAIYMCKHTHAFQILSCVISKALSGNVFRTRT